jgi:hypothetical protein
LNKIYVPALDAETWKQFLAQPEKQWKEGYSARTLAYSWQEAHGFPTELLLALPEHKVSLPGGARASQNDIWALARSENNLISIAVEGKVAESFDKTVEEWQKDSTSGSGKQARLDYLTDLLRLPSNLTTIRYQLLHRTASAIIEAQRFNAPHAVMLVHSFSPSSQWFQDYVEFVALMGGGVATKDSLVSVGVRSGISLHLAWVSGDKRYLTK